MANLLHTSTRRPPRPWLVALPLMAATWLSGQRAEAQFIRRFALRGELGAGTMLSEFQRNQGFDWGYQLTPRLGFSLVDSLAIQGSFSTWSFPSPRGVGRVTMITGGVRFEPELRSVGRLFVDANVGSATTGGLKRLGFDVGVGFEFRAASFLSLGPVLRYGQVVQLDSTDANFTADALFWSAGLSVVLRSQGERAARAGEGSETAPNQDSDGDGIPNSVDRCREEPETRNGFEDDDGCPDSTDRDHDGIANADDRCPEEAEDRDGFQDEDGCADTDDDNDGIPDLADQCPREAEVMNGVTDDDGCPDAAGDRDHDGIADDRDRCPGEPETFNGVTDEDGCPDRGAVLVTIDGDQIRIAEQVNFEPNRATIRGHTSPRILDTVATLLRLSPQISRVDIQGYTDDRGDPEANRVLSEQRATTVMRYLVGHGIEASRLEAHGFGQERPLVPNTGNRARRQNRRVEFHITTVGASATPSAALVTPPATPEATPAVTPVVTPEATPVATPVVAPAPETGGRHGRHGHHGHHGRHH